MARSADQCHHTAERQQRWRDGRDAQLRSLTPAECTGRLSWESSCPETTIPFRRNSKLCCHCTLSSHPYLLSLLSSLTLSQAITSIFLATPPPPFFSFTHFCPVTSASISLSISRFVHATHSSLRGFLHPPGTCPQCSSLIYPSTPLS